MVKCCTANGETILNWALEHHSKLGHKIISVVCAGDVLPDNIFSSKKYVITYECEENYVGAYSF